MLPWSPRARISIQGSSHQSGGREHSQAHGSSDNVKARASPSTTDIGNFYNRVRIIPRSRFRSRKEHLRKNRENTSNFSVYFHYPHPRCGVRGFFFPPIPKTQACTWPSSRPFQQWWFPLSRWFPSLSLSPLLLCWRVCRTTPPPPPPPPPHEYILQYRSLVGSDESFLRTQIAIFHTVKCHK